MEMPESACNKSCGRLHFEAIEYINMPIALQTKVDIIYTNISKVLHITHFTESDLNIYFVLKYEFIKRLANMVKDCGEQNCIKCIKK